LEAEAVNQSRRTLRIGFTLVELLVVIAIIGILVALLLPAIQAAREAARRSECVNHLKQVGIGFLNHESTHRFLPCSGWNAFYLGDPLMGFGREQPGGWMYQILPYIEEKAVFDLTNDNDKLNVTTLQREKSKELQQTVIPMFNCPSRRPARLQRYALSNIWNPKNGDRSLDVARGDYAANGGDGEEGCEFWWIEDTQTYEKDLEWLVFNYTDLSAHKWPPFTGQTGVNYTGAEIKVTHVIDGMSKTYMVGEKFMNPELYETDGTVAGGDNHSLYQGFDWDVNRWTSVNDEPMQDRVIHWTREGRFGSAHNGGFNMLFCDGSVQTVSYDVATDVHRRAGNRHDNGEQLREQIRKPDNEL
jgi:prepilin-type N-terminal cleavage/methylation domain-containing protein/prepilin-type processing-associated H-X9-DG protein